MRVRRRQLSPLEASAGASQDPFVDVRALTMDSTDSLRKQASTEARHTSYRDEEPLEGVAVNTSVLDDKVAELQAGPRCFPTPASSSNVASKRGSMHETPRREEGRLRLDDAQRCSLLFVCGMCRTSTRQSCALKAALHVRRRTWGSFWSSSSRGDDAKNCAPRSEAVVELLLVSRHDGDQICVPPSQSNEELLRAAHRHEESKM